MARRVWLRRYPANSRWHGWLPPQAIASLREAGNTVTPQGDGTYMLNSTAPAQEPVTATLIAVVQPSRGCCDA